MTRLHPNPQTLNPKPHDVERGTSTRTPRSATSPLPKAAAAAAADTTTTTTAEEEQEEEEEEVKEEEEEEGEEDGADEVREEEEEEVMAVTPPTEAVTSTTAGTAVTGPIGATARRGRGRGHPARRRPPHRTGWCDRRWAGVQHSSTLQLNLSRFGHTSPCPTV
jgi:hypothetical protein